MVGEAFKGVAAVAILPMIFIGLISIFFFVIWILMLVHAIKHPIKDKPLWIIVLLVGQGIGAIIYYFVVKRHYVAAPIAASVPPAPTPPPAV